MAEEADAAWRLLCEKIAEATGAAQVRRWEPARVQALAAVLDEHKELVEPADLYLLQRVRAAFGAAGLRGVEARKHAVDVMVAHLYPECTPQGTSRAAAARQFLLSAQAGALYAMRPLLHMYPSVLTACSTSKGYTAMHYAAMAGATPLLTWLAENGLPPHVRSTPSDDSAPCTPLQLATSYHRLEAAEELRTLQDGLAFLARLPPETPEPARLRAAVEGGHAAAARVLLRRSRSLACAPPLHEEAATSVLCAAARRGDTAVLAELLRHGAAEAAPSHAHAAQQAAVSRRHAAAADLLEAFLHARKPLELGSWSEVPEALVHPPHFPPLGALALDVKLSRSRWQLVEAADLLLSSCQGSPALEESMLAWVERTLDLPVWLPVHPVVYEQLRRAVSSAADSLSSAELREAVLPLVSSHSDAMLRLCSLLKYCAFPSYAEADLRKFLPEVLGAGVVDAYWERLTPPMRKWVAQVVYLLPLTPWGVRRATSTVTIPTASERAAQLQLVMLELLTKARLLFHLFERTDGAASAPPPGPQPEEYTHSVFPYLPDRPDSCPYPKKPTFDPSDPSSFSAVLLLLAPASPSAVSAAFPQLLLLNGEGIGGELRHKCAHRVATRFLLNRLPSANPRWVLLPAVYSEQLALAALGKLRGPRHVLLRHPHGGKFQLHGGGEVGLDAAELDGALRVLLLPPEDERRREVSARVCEIVRRARFWEEEEGRSLASSVHGSGVLLLEELVSSAKLPHESRRGLFDPTHRGYVMHLRRGPREVAAGEPADECVVLSGAARFPPHEVRAGVGMCTHSQRVAQPAHLGLPLGPEMASGAFTRRLPLREIFDCLHCVSLRDLVTHLLQSNVAILHLAALSILGSAVDGARRVVEDKDVLNYAYYEAIGRPFAPFAVLWPEHKPLLMAMADPKYGMKHGGAIATVVGLRLVADVVQRDFHAVACNHRRKPDPEVIELCLALERSKIQAVRLSAEAVHETIAAAAATGMHPTTQIPVADPATLNDLVRKLNQHLYRSEGTQV
ncbi:hypothetical protein AB1Y20_016047 [Prymnesium parvum]|uniref:Uncharacterized protein n=1 Tax=Prymnesium parvum TaxID=97485 RepID=A0AB34K2F9_PRYPA